MLFNTLILALSCAHAWASLAAANDDGDCALYLTGPGRSSAYDYSINLLKGNFGYDGQHTCITYDAINQAYLEARQRILVAQPKGEWKPEDYASVGELVLDISINIARRYGLTYEEIEKGLPLIDTSRTLIREVCPPVFSHVECRAGKYRRLDGLCNNLKHPTWGATNAPFQRLLSPLFSDGINAPRISHSGRDLPLSRVVSRTMHPDDGFHDHAGTVMVIAWGQFMDHDYTLTGTPLDPINRNDPEECCKRPPHLKHPYCNEIRIPDDDYFYRLFGVKCIDFVRGFPSPRPGCRLGSRTPFNTLTGAIDGNTVYGVTEKFARKLRTGFGGLLRMNPVFKEYGLKDLLPLKLDIPDEGCTRPNKNMYCFEAGEIRVNEQLVLTVMHTLMAREHNRVAQGLAEVNPHWDDETLYQESRRINIAEIQHITYNEFLPILLGKDVMEKFGLVLEKEGYWEGYDDEVNPDVLASFASAAYRFGHSLLPTAIERWSKAHKFIASKRLSDLIRRPYDLYRAGVLDEYVMGLMNQVAQAMDDSITQEVTNHLFKKVGARFGMDLVSFNMQRGREFGIPGYMEFRKFCGLPGAETFQELFGSMTNQTVRKYETIFEHPIDVDLWSGGVSERPLPGSMLGPTFACIIATQFSYSRRGDRFWFELPNQPSSFTPEQLAEIRKSRMARVICDNTDIIDTVQLYPMVLPDHELNPRVPCRSGILPAMDFSKWAEPAPFHNANAKEFITYALSSRNVTKNNATIQNEQNKKNTQINNQISVLQNNVSCNDCNKTDETNSNEAVQCNTSKTSVSCFNKTLLSYVDKDQINDTVNTQKDDTDAILKYVYKKNETKDEKSKGHYKNSLRRKKRNVDSQRDQTAPLIVNYETLHSPERDREEWLPAKNTANFITGAELADFNIETLHENVGSKKILNKVNANTHNDAREQNDSSEVINRDEDKRDNRESSEEKEDIKQRDSEENTQRNSDERDSSSSNENSDEDVHDDGTDDRSNESKERDLDDQKEGRKNNFNSDESKFTKSLGREIDDNDSRKDNYSGDRFKFTKPLGRKKVDDDSHKDNYSNNRSKFTKPLGRERDDDDSHKDNYSNDHSKFTKPLRRETQDDDESHKKSYRENTKITKPPRKGQINNEDDIHKNKYSDNTSKYSNPQQESDESSESREEIDDKKNTDPHSKQNFGNNSDKEISRYKVHENNDQNDNRNNSPPDIQDVDLDDFSYERIQLNKNGVVETARDALENKDVEIIPNKFPKPFTKPHAESNYAPGESSESTSVEAVEPIHINDGEVKPVVEINSDANGNESDEENSSLNNESLETLTGVKGDESDEKYDKLLEEKKTQNNGGIKQQFERIPLNYNHEQANTKDPKADDLQNKEEIIPVTPHVHYDDNLNIKFDDIAIKLPEIKLPDDILAYNYEEPPVYKANEKNKQKFFHYNSEERNERPREKTAHNDKYEANDDDDDDDGNDSDYQKANSGYHKGGDYEHNDDADDHGNYYGKPNKQAYKKTKDNEEDEDPYEKFVRERFGKRETFKQRSEKLRDLDVHNPELYKTVQHILEKTKNVKKEAEKSGDPNAGYLWTLEYGQKI